MEDFGYVEKIEFPPDGNNKPPHCTPPHALAHTFKFKTYAPKVFSKIRQFFSVDSAAYMESMCGILYCRRYASPLFMAVR